MTDTKTNPFQNFTFGNDEPIFQNEGIEGWRFTFNKALKRIRYFQGKAPASEDELNTARNEVDKLEKELEDIKEKWIDFEELAEKKAELARASSRLNFMLADETLRGEIYFSSDSEIQEFLDLAMRAKKKTAPSIARATWYRGGNLDLETLANNPIPNTNWWWINC